MKRKLLCVVLLGLVFLTGCKKDSSDIDTVSSVKTDDAVLISVLEKYPKVDFASEDEIETIYISDQAAEWKEDFDTSDYENYDENVEEFCEQMDELMEAELEAGRIADYTKNDYCYMVEFESGEITGYTIPTPEDFLAGDGDGINIVVTIWPCMSDKVARQASGAKDAAAYIESSYEIEDVISYEFEKKEDFGVIVEPWLNIKPGDIVIVESHGTHNEKDNSQICIGQNIEKSSIFEYADSADLEAKTVGNLEWKSGLIPYNETVSLSGKKYMDLYISKTFFETFYKPGDLDGTVFYFGTCGSMKDNQLASTLCSLGAEVVIGWDALAYSAYEKDSCQNLFKLLSEGECLVEAISMTKLEFYSKYNETFYKYDRIMQKAWGEMYCYPANSTFTLNDMAKVKDVEEPEAETERPPMVSEEETKPEEVDYSQMKETYLGNVTLLYTDSYNQSESVGKVPCYYSYIVELQEIFDDYPSCHSEDATLYGSHPEFEIDGLAAPFVYFDSLGSDEITEANQFLFDCATQQSETYGLCSWGLLPNMPQAFREPLEEVMYDARVEYFINKEDLVRLAMKATERYEYIDEKGREVFGFNAGHSSYYTGQEIVETDEYNLHACISIAFDYTYPYNENPYNEDMYFSIETENGVQHYKMEMVSLYVTQACELNRIACVDHMFAKELEYWYLFNNDFGMKVELYQLTE